MGRVLRLLSLLSLAACRHTEWQARLSAVGDLRGVDREAPFLKVHINNGEVYALARWSVDEAGRAVVGEGIRYDLRRREISRGRHRVPFDQVALLETNRPRSVTHVGAAVLGVVTAASLSVSLYCAQNTKACFGSCPTFYTDAGGGLALRAEGFSGAVARALEETDVDAMPEARVNGGRVEVVMRNEAAETHAVQSVRLLAAPRPQGRRVLRSSAGFYSVGARAAPTTCRARDRDCTAAVSASDGREDSPRVDPTDLGATETIELSYPRSAGRRGLAITARNALVGTFVFYQLLAWLGRDAGAFVAALDREGPERERGLRAMRIGRELARIRIEARAPGGPWLPAGEYDELGPIARETQVVVLPEALPEGPVDLRLTLTRGFWKLDELALATLEPAPAPAPIEPIAVLRRGVPDPGALARLRDPGLHLFTSPGDAYTLVYEVPGGGEVELFLESRGYYVEWIRDEWLREQSPDEAARFLADPRAAMRRLAPAYARIEHGVEDLFWRSRVGEAP